MTSYLQSRYRFRRPGPGSGSYLQTRGAFRQPLGGFRDAGITTPPDDATWLPPFVALRSFYVDGVNGNDGNPGTQAQPWQTIGRAIDVDNQHPGDEIVVMPGTYFEQLWMDQSGNADNYIRLRAATPGTVFLTMNPNEYSLLRVRSANYVIVEGLDIVAGGGHAIDVEDCHHVVIRNCACHHSGGGGIETAFCEWLLIENNHCYNNCAINTFQTSGISIWVNRNNSGDSTTPGFRSIIRNNVCHDNSETAAIANEHTDGNGIIVDSLQGLDGDINYTFPTLVENNLCYRNGGKGIQVVWSDFVTVRNNTCWRNNLDNANLGTWRGELNNGFSDNNTWVNNIGYADPAVNANNTAILSGDHALNTVWHNNLTFNGTPGQASISVSEGNETPTAVDGNLLGVNPLFVAVGTDFHLQASSPAIGAGTTAFGVGATDLAGSPRVVGAIDMGCYERQS